MTARLGLLLCGLAVVAAACGDSSDTTTTTAAVTTTAPTEASGLSGTGPTGTAPATTVPVGTTTTSLEFSLPDFTIIERTDDNVLVVAVPPGTYSDLDLQNLVNEIIERFAPVNGLHIIDDETIADLVLADDVTAAEQEQLDEHYFLSLEEGFRMVFLGPFSDVEDVIIGS